MTNITETTMPRASANPFRAITRFVGAENLSLIIALVLFLIIKGINRLKRPAPHAPDAPPPPPTRTEQLLQDIKDELAKR